MPDEPRDAGPLAEPLEPPEPPEPPVDGAVAADDEVAVDALAPLPMRSAGPPADWLEKVRRHAPGLLLGGPPTRSAMHDSYPRRRADGRFRRPTGAQRRAERTVAFRGCRAGTASRTASPIRGAGAPQRAACAHRRARSRHLGQRPIPRQPATSSRRRKMLPRRLSPLPTRANPFGARNRDCFSTSRVRHVPLLSPTRSISWTSQHKPITRLSFSTPSNRSGPAPPSPARDRSMRQIQRRSAGSSRGRTRSRTWTWNRTARRGGVSLA